MKILVVGNGGREHAIAWKLLQQARIEQVVCVPGNGGTASLERCQNLPLNMDDFEGISKFALDHDISLVVVVCLPFPVTKPISLVFISSF